MAGTARFAFVLGLCAGALQAQVPTEQNAASTKSRFMSTSGVQASAVAASSSYRLVASLGSVAGRTRSKSFDLQASWTAGLGASTVGRPWLTAVRPLFTTLGGGTNHRLLGTRMHLGSSVCTVGGIAARVGPRTSDAAVITIGANAVPGWQPVVFATSTGTTTLPRGVGVMPMLDVRTPFYAAGGWTRSSIRYYGTPGDAVIWFMASGRGQPIRLPGVGYSFQLHFPSFFFLVATVAGATGETRLQLPGLPFSRPLSAQGLVLTTNPAYAPAAFTNPVDL